MTLALALTAGFGEVKTRAYAEERRAFDDSSVYISNAKCCYVQ